MTGQEVAPAGPSLAEQLEIARQRISHLESELSIASMEVRNLRRDVAAHEMRGQEIAAKWRKRNQQLAVELQLAQAGLTSGCGCPIGECQQRGSDEGSCWLQWAEAHVLARMANMRIGDLQRAANHPRRFREARLAGGPPAKRLASPEPDANGIVREPGIEDEGSSSSHS